MTSFDILFIVFGAVDILSGLASIFTGKVYMMGSSVNKYTEESLRKYSRPHGFMNLFAGSGLIAFNLIKTDMHITGSFSIHTGTVILIAAALVSIVLLVANRKVLVKKQTAQAA